jgi:phytoene synthase
MTAEPRSAVRAPQLMAAAYSSLLDKMIAVGFAPPRQRMKISRLRMLGALLRYGLL